MLEHEFQECGDSAQQRCFTHVYSYESDTLDRLTTYSLPPIAVAGQSYGQRGLFVFHSSDGAQQFMISKLFAMPNPDAEYYLTELE